MYGIRVFFIVFIIKRNQILLAILLLSVLTFFKKNFTFTAFTADRLDTELSSKAKCQRHVYPYKHGSVCI